MRIFRFEHGRSYAWWFGIFMAVYVAGILFGLTPWVILALPATMILLLSCELRSGVALDSWWRASYARGTWQYGASIAWHTTALIAFVVLSYWMIKH